MHQNIRDDFNQLADCCILQAEYFLKHQDGEFYPFGACIEPSGKIVPIGIYEGEEHPLSDKLIDSFKQIFAKQLLAGEIKAYAIAYDVRITNETYPQSIDAIATLLAHCESEDQFVYYFPYAIIGGTIEFYESFGEKHNVSIQ